MLRDDFRTDKRGPDVLRRVAIPLLLGLACSEEQAAPPAGAPVEAEKTVATEDERLLEALGYIASEPRHERSGVVRHDSTSAYPGLNLHVSQHAQAAFLEDMEGRRLHTWTVAPGATDAPRNARRGPLAWRTVRLLADGGLIAQTDFGSLARLDRDSQVVWVRRTSTHHDFDVSEDGRIFALDRRRSNVPGFAGRIVEDLVVALDLDGKELDSVSMLEALVEGGQTEIVRELQHYQRNAKRGLAVDPLHTNALEWIGGAHAAKHPAFARGHLLLSLPMIGRIVVLDFDAGRVVWSLQGTFRYQHDPTLLENGHVLLFDNKGLEGERSRVLEIDPATGREVWSHGEEGGEPFYSECCGRVQRLPNGNTLVVDSKTGRAFEVDPHHAVVWEFRTPHTVGDRVAILFDLVRLSAEDMPAEWRPR
jgi:outer membrane protein assembly factor BamB